MDAASPPLVLILSYLLGSIPFGLILTRLAGHGDIRAIGSGNIGATNVLRTGNKKLAAAVLLLDGAKGFVATRFLGDPNLAVLGAVLGHVFPMWLKFKGGKGVATLLGAWLGFGWPGLIPPAIWLATALLFRISSLAAIVAVGSVPVLMFAFGIVVPSFFSNFPDHTLWPTHEEWLVLLPHLLVAALVIGRHKDNIARLRAGTEPKIGDKG